MITTYTFTLPKKNNNTSANNFKESLAEKFLNAYPWLGGKKEKKTTVDLYLLDTIPTNLGYTANDFLSNKYNLEDELLQDLVLLQKIMTLKMNSVLRFVSSIISFRLATTLFLLCRAH